MRTLFVHLGLEDVAVGANILHLVHPRWHRTMVSVAGSAGGRTQIATHHHRLIVHAGVVLCELIGRNAV